MKQDGYTLLFAVTSQMFPRSRDLTLIRLPNDVARIAEISDTLEISTVSCEEMGVGWLGGLSGPLNRFPSFNRLYLARAFEALRTSCDE